MKYITFTVPCYNSEDYMRRCIDSLLAGGRDVEIILINDGSTDGTAKIADEYQLTYPDIIRTVHKENGGHGSGVNKGLELARGIYYKVVDSDDWLDQEAYSKLLARVKEFCGAGCEESAADTPDLFVCNYVYDHLDEGRNRSINYRNVFPAEERCSWKTIGHFRPSQYLIMHSLMFKTEILRQSGVKLPEHTFYVDNLFSYQPLPYVKDIYYMDIDLYHYYLGREDQSVNEKVLMKRIDQQIRVTELVAECVDLNEVKKKYPKLASYMTRNISIMLSISSIHLLLIKTVEAEQKRRNLWERIRAYDPSLYFRLRFSTLSGLTYLPGRIGGKLTVGGYRFARKIYQFQ
ncbi:MAG TPA: glycosyltransferase family 2 protein [Candidatus Mediterraneibacter pullistercoris]|nr:glycosyltransferase family 2 protein [Candidatus Mediterraneibacter pullistercoris]